MDATEVANAPTAYQTLCASYNAIDSFRGTLLGFLPLATSGLFLLAGDSSRGILSDPKLSVPLGLFGLLVSLGLFIFEIYGIRRCTHLIIAGRHLERQLKTEGQFLHRPNGVEGFISAKLSRLVNEPMASGVIYPAVGAAWLYLGLQSLNPWLAASVATLIFMLGFIITFRYNKWLADKDWPEAEGTLEQARESRVRSSQDVSSATDEA
jgi:hypothetical protein